MKILGGLAIALVALVGSLQAEEFYRAFLPDDAVCFDLPVAIEKALDLNAIARRALGEKTFGRPTARQLAAHYWEVGSYSTIPFDAPLPQELTTRSWVLLSMPGVRPI